VPHLPLHAPKLSEIGLIRCIRSYLAGRSQLISINGYNYATQPVISGIPQGSVLGPLVFVSYLNDVAQAISSDSDVIMFADDIALYCVIRTRDDYVQGWTTYICRRMLIPFPLALGKISQ